jgi:hypothetical protein
MKKIENCTKCNAKITDHEIKNNFCSVCYKVVDENADKVKKGGYDSVGSEESKENDKADIDNRNIQNVVVTDIKMSFSSMVVFMVKWVIASIPAALIILFIIGLLTSFFGAFLLAIFN